MLNNLEVAEVKVLERRFAFIPKQSTLLASATCHVDSARYLLDFHNCLPFLVYLEDSGLRKKAWAKRKFLYISWDSILIKVLEKAEATI